MERARGGFLSVFWAGGGEMSGVVLFPRQSGGPLCGFLPWVLRLRGSGSVLLRGLDIEHFVHGLLSMGLGPLFPTVELYVHVHG